MVIGYIAYYKSTDKHRIHLQKQYVSNYFIVNK